MNKYEEALEDIKDFSLIEQESGDCFKLYDTFVKEECDILQEACKKAEAFDIISKLGFSPKAYEISNNVTEYNLFSKFDNSKLTKEEFNLLKEVLENEN